MTDQEIIALTQNPSTQQQGFRLLVEKFQKKVYWHVRKMVVNHDDANDITQDTFIKVWNSLNNFRGDAQLFTWIYRIATNECLNFLNKKNKYAFADIAEIEHSYSDSDLEPLTDGDAVQMKLQKALQSLPDKQRLVFNMKYYDDLKYEEIAEITGTSVGALKASYHLAVKKIEEFLNDD